MEKGRVLKILREHEPELRAAGVARLRVFGSVARDEASSSSDVDILADFDGSRPLTLVTVGRLQVRLADMLGVEVDLSSPEWLREPVRSQAIQEALVAF
jgi:predicted nucleotidyltransferase